MDRAGSSHCLQKFTFRCPEIHHTVRSSSKRPLIVRCTRVCRRKSIVRRNFSGKAEPSCHVERSREISYCFRAQELLTTEIVRDSSTLLGMTRKNYFSPGYNHSTYSATPRSSEHC